MDFENWYDANRCDIPRIFTESVSLIDVLKKSDALTEKISRKFNDQSSDVLKKIARLENEYDEAHKDLLNITNKGKSSSTIMAPSSILPTVQSDVFILKQSTSSLRPPEPVVSPRSKALRGFSWGTVKTDDILQPSLVYSYWNATGRADHTWLDFASWNGSIGNKA